MALGTSRLVDPLASVGVQPVPYQETPVATAAPTPTARIVIHRVQHRHGALGRAGRAILVASALCDIAKRLMKVNTGRITGE
jgi:hypothetical protein